MRRLKPTYGKDARRSKLKVYKLKSHLRTTENKMLNLNKSNMEHEEVGHEFRYERVDKVYAVHKFTNAMANVIFTDSSSTVKFNADIKIQMYDKIITNDGLIGIIQGEPIVSGNGKFKEYMVVFG